MQLIKDYCFLLFLGIKNHSIHFVLLIFIAYSSIWTVVESLSTYYIKDFMDQHPLNIEYILIISLVFAIFKIFQPHRIEIKMHNSDTILSIYFGDIFEQKSYKAIAVNEYFDSEFGDPVSENSLHGITLKKYFIDNIEEFDEQINQSLRNISHEIVDREKGKKNKYPIGTTVHIQKDNNNFLFFVLCHTNVETYKAYSSLEDMIVAIKGLLEKAKNTTNGNYLVIPLLGSGLSGLGLPATQLLQIIILTIMNVNKQNEICKKIDIVLHRDRMEEIDLQFIKKQWN